MWLFSRYCLEEAEVKLIGVKTGVAERALMMEEGNKFGIYAVIPVTKREHAQMAVSRH